MNAAPTQALITNPVLIFFIVLVIILLAPILLKRLKIPHVVGLIVAGVVVGPFGFNLLSRDSSFEIFGQVGLLYLMFLAGLEIDMYHLKRNMSKGFVFGLLTFGVPFVLGMIASVYVLNVGWSTSILLAAMYSAHTLIAYPVVSRFEITKSPVVLISIVGTIMAVLGSLVALALGVGIHRDGGFDATFLLRLFALIVIYGLSILYIYPRLTRWFFKTFNDSISQFVYVLAMVFLAAWMAQVIGLEAVLGAFFAGLVLNRYVPSLSPLMGRLEFVGNALFIPYFLIGVGMLINVRVITQQDTLWVAINMIAVAIFTKWFAAWLAQKSYHMDSADRNMMFGLTSAHTAVALAVVMIGYNVVLPDGSRLLNESILNGTILMILVTCAIAPIATERAAIKIQKRMKHEGLIEDSPKQTRNKNALITVSNPITATGLVDLAIMMGENKGAGSLFALHVRTDDSRVAIMDAENILKVTEKRAAGADIELQSIERYDLNVVAGIANTVKEKNIGTLIMGLHYRNNIVDSFFGAKIEQLLHQTNKMVLITRCFIPLNTITRILVVVPNSAEFESGFKEWVLRIGNITSQIGCRVIFHSSEETAKHIKQVIYEYQLGIRNEYVTLDSWSDYIMLTNDVLEDDLLIMIGARRTSISFDKEMDNLPSILSKYFNHNNLLMIYPEQFGKEPQFVTFNDPLSTDIMTPSGFLLKLRNWYKWLIVQKKKITHHNRTKNKID